MSDHQTGDTVRKTVTAAAGLGYLFDAYVINIYGVTLAVIAAEFSQDLKTMGIVGSIFILGYAIGSFAFGMMGDRLGRKVTLGLSILGYGLFTAATGFAQNIFQFAIGRFFTGVGGGGELTVGVPYVIEAWPVRRRVKGTAIMFGGYIVGLLLSTLSAKFLLQTVGWRSVYWVSIIPAILILIFRLKLEESPRYSETIATLKLKKRKQIGLFTALKNPRTAKALIVGAMIYTSITSIYYAQSFYEVTYMKQHFGVELGDAILILGGFNIAMLIGTVLSAYVGDRFGRKLPSLWTAVVCAVSIWLMYSTDSLAQYVAYGAICFGCIALFWPIGMAYVGELFPTEIRASGFGWSVAIGRSPSIFAPMIIAYVGSIAVGGIGAAMKWSFVILIFVVIAYLWGPETEGREIVDLHDDDLEMGSIAPKVAPSS